MDEINLSVSAMECRLWKMPPARWAQVQGRMVGLADAAMFSFNGNKVATAGGASVVVKQRSMGKAGPSVLGAGRTGLFARRVGSNLRMTEQMRRSPSLN